MKRKNGKLWIVSLIALCMLVSMTVLGSGVKLDSSIAIAPEYEAAQEFSDGYAAVMKDGKWGYIDETGKVVVDFKYDVAWGFSEGVAVAATVEDLTVIADLDAPEATEALEAVYVYHLVDAAGKDVVLEAATEWYGEGTVEYGFVPKYTAEAAEGSWQCYNGVVNVASTPYTAEGALIEPAAYLSGNNGVYDYYYVCGPSVDGVIPVTFGYLGQDGTTTCAYIGLDGKVIREFEKADWAAGTGVCEVYAPDNGLIMVQTLQGAVADEPGMCYVGYGVMTEDGKWVAEPKYLDFYYSMDGTFFANGVLPLCDAENKWGVIDAKGATVVDFDYQWIGVCSNGYMPAQKADGTCVYLDAEGKEYPIDGAATMITSFSEDGLAAVYDAASGKAYCVYENPVEGKFVAVQNSDNMAASVYFPGYEDGTPELMVQPSALVAIEVDGKWGYLKLEAAEAPFEDVEANRFYYDAVIWAVENEVTTGKTETTFAPDADATRAEVVTFLWRAAGCPEPTSTENPFKDVEEGRFYYKAVLWAVEEGITKGVKVDEFAPEQKCTRGEIVTFLWRVAETPEAEAENPFADVEKGRFYYDAVQWAVEEEITKGVKDDQFAPEQNCTRGEIVTFLYRYYN